MYKESEGPELREVNMERIKQGKIKKEEIKSTKQHLSNKKIKGLHIHCY